MSEPQELQLVEIHRGWPQLFLAVALVFVLLLGGIGIVAIEHRITAHGYILTVRCLPDMHLNNSSYQFNGTYQFALPVAIPTYLPYQEAKLILLRRIGIQVVLPPLCPHPAGRYQRSGAVVA